MVCKEVTSGRRHKEIIAAKLASFSCTSWLSKRLLMSRAHQDLERPGSGQVSQPAWLIHQLVVIDSIYLLSAAPESRQLNCYLGERLKLAAQLEESEQLARRGRKVKVSSRVA